MLNLHKTVTQRQEAREDLRFAERKITQLKEMSKSRDVSIDLKRWEAIAERKRKFLGTT